MSHLVGLVGKAILEPVFSFLIRAQTRYLLQVLASNEWICDSLETLVGHFMFTREDEQYFYYS